MANILMFVDVKIRKWLIDEHFRERYTIVNFEMAEH